MIQPIIISRKIKDDLKFPLNAVTDVWTKGSCQQEAPVKHHCWKKRHVQTQLKLAKEHIDLLKVWGSVGSEPYAMAGRVCIIYLYFGFVCSGGSLLFSCLGVPCGCSYVMHVPMCCRHSSGVSGFSWVSLSAFLQVTRVLVSHFQSSFA